MGGKIISIVACASLTFLAMSIPSVVMASTVTTKGSTQATIYGFTYAQFAWDKQTTNLPDLSNMPEPNPNSIAEYNTQLYKSTYDKVNSQAESWLTRLCLRFKNTDARVKILQFCNGLKNFITV